MEKENAIALLHVNDSPNAAEEFNKVLRNSGMALSPTIAATAEDLQQALKKKRFDIILIAPPLKQIDAAIALTIVKRHGNGAAPLIIGIDNANERLDFMEKGARDSFPDEPAGLLLAIVKREVEALSNCRTEDSLHSRLDDAEKRCNMLMDSSRDAIAYIHEGMHIHINESYAKMFGYEDVDDLAGMPIMDMVASDDQQQFKAFIRDYSKLKPEDANEENSKLSVHGLKADDESFAMEMELAPAYFEGEQCTQLIIRDDSMNSELQAQLQEKLEALSTIDQKTSLFNRNYLLERLESCILNAKNTTQESGLLVLTVDNFETLREQLGYQGSDEVIINLATRIKECAGEKAVASRVESYTFGVLLENLDKNATLDVAESLRKSIDEHIAKAEDQSVITTCSIGVYMVDATSSSSNAVLRAKKASQQAIDAGGNKVELFVLDAKEMAAGEELALWEQQLKKAFKSNLFYLVYQPIISLQGDETHNYEVLVRMNDSDGNTIYPSDFLPAAEQTGQMVQLDRWIIANACKRMGEQLVSEPNIRFNVKLSSQSLTDEMLIPWIEDHLGRNKLKPSQLSVELSIRQVSAHMLQAKELFKTLNSMGIEVSLEHFSGTSDCFAVLKHLSEVSIIKLDTSLVRDIATNTEHMEQVQKVCAELSEMDKKTIAAGIEDPGGLSVIWQSGSHYIQGLFLQEPIPELGYDFNSFV